MSEDAPDYEALRIKAAQEGIEAVAKQLFYGPDDSNTPRTDAEHAKTLTPAYEHVGAEQEAWEWARKLEKELASAGLRIYELDEELEHVRESYEKYNLLSTRPFSELF